MKKFKFSLEGLLKIRSLKEQECKAQIGKLQIDIEELRNAIGGHKKGVNDIYHSQEELLKNGMTGQELKFFPYFFESKDNHIRLLERDLAYKEEELKELFEELAKRRAELKVISNMKEKQALKHKKDANKKEMQKIEEQIQNWAISSKG